MRSRLRAPRRNFDTGAFLSHQRREIGPREGETTMKPMLQKTMLAVLATSVALGGTLPAFAQEAVPPTPPAATAPNAQLPMPPMGQMGPMMGSMGMMGGAGPGFDLKSFDVNGDGKVTLAEITESRAAKVKSIDADGDGKLSAEELTTAELAAAMAGITARVQARIAAQDADGDGKLAAAELALPPVPTRLFDRFDANDDGALSEDEIAKAQARMQDRMQGHGRGDRGPDGHRWFGFGRN